MQTLTPSAQEGTEGLQGVQEAPSDQGPFIEGSAPALWVGFGAFILVLLVTMILIIRGRVIKPAQRKAAVKSAVFEPAGEDAEITFDDDFDTAAEPPDAAIEEKAAREDEIQDSNPSEDAKAAGDEPALSAERPIEKPKRSPFAGLFSRKKNQEKSDGDEEQELGALEDGEEAAAPEPADAENSVDDVAATDIEEAFSERRRMADEADAASLVAARELEEMRAEEEARAQAEQEAAFERRKNRAAIEQGLQSFAELDEARQEAPAAHTASAEDMIHQVSAAFEDRMAPLFDRLDAKIENVAHAAASHDVAADHAVISEAHFSEFAELLSEQIASLREAANNAIEGLSARIATLEAAPAGAAALSSQIADLNRILGGALNTAPETQAALGDILNRALPPKSFALSHALSNGKVAAALVTMPGGAPIVVDDHFPVDAFAAYQRQRLGAGGSVTAENNFPQHCQTPHR